MIKELWPNVSLKEFNNWYPLTGKIVVTPERYFRKWPDKVDEWFKTFALRAQNDINAYLNFALDTFDISTFKDKRIIETLVDMVFVCIEHWVYNRTPIEFNSNSTLTFNNSQTQFNSFAMPTINIWDLHPSRMKIWANLTGLKNLWDTAQEGVVDAKLIDLNQYYSKMQTDMLLDKKANKSEIPDVSKLETKEEHNKDINSLQNNLNNKINSFAGKNELSPNYHSTDELGAIPSNFFSTSLKTEEKDGVGAINKLLDTKAEKDFVDSLANTIANKANKSDLELKQNQLTKDNAGDNVSITGSGANIKISANKSGIPDEIKTPFAIISDTNNQPLINANYAQRIFYYNDGTPALWILEDSIRFTYPSENGNAVTLEYQKADGKLLYGATSSLSEIATKADLPDISKLAKKSDVYHFIGSYDNDSTTFEIPNYIRLYNYKFIITVESGTTDYDLDYVFDAPGNLTNITRLQCEQGNHIEFNIFNGIIEYFHKIKKVIILGANIVKVQNPGNLDLKPSKKIENLDLEPKKEFNQKQHEIDSLKKLYDFVSQDKNDEKLKEVADSINKELFKIKERKND